MLVTLTSAILLLLALDILLPEWPAYNGAVAIIFLVIPADMARLWLAGHIIFTTMLFLLAICFMALFWRDGRWWAWLAGMVIIGLSLNYYESTVGVIIALSVLAGLFGRHRTQLQRLSLLAPAVLAALYAIGRWYWQTVVGTAYGHATDNVTFAPGDLLERLSFGAGYTLRKSWLDPMLDWLQTKPGAGMSAVGETILLAAVVLLPMLAVYGLFRATRPAEPAGSVRARRRDLAIAAAVGFVVLIAGYFPVILASYPGTGYSASRLHNLPTIGAALVIGAGMFALGLWMGRTPSRARAIALAGLAPLVILGIAGHLATQQNIRRAWADQQLFWQSLFNQAPDFADDTYVLLMITGYDTSTKGPVPFISGYWGITHALRLLYGNPELNADFVYADPQQTLSINGDNLILDYFGTWKYPASETVVFAFDGEERQLVRLSQLERNGVILPLGTGRIVETPTMATEFRWLVSGE